MSNYIYKIFVAYIINKIDSEINSCLCIANANYPWYGAPANTKKMLPSLYTQYLCQIHYVADNKNVAHLRHYVHISIICALEHGNRKV